MKSYRIVVSKKLVFINSLSSGIAKVLNVTVLIWLYQYLVKRVDAAEYSLLPLVGSLMVFAPLVSTVLTGGVGRFILEAHAKGDESRVRQIVSSMVPVLVGGALLIVCVGAILVWNIAHLLNIAPDHLWEAQMMLGIMVFMFALRLVCAPFGVGLFVHQKYVLSNLINLGAQMLRIVLLLALLHGLGTRVLYVVLANAGSEVVGLAATQVISRRLLPTLRFAFVDINRFVAREVLSFGGWNFVTQLASTLRQSADVIVLNKLATPVDVTTFALGSVPDRTIRQTTIELTGPILPAVTALHAMDARERLRNAFLRTGKYSMLLALAIATPLIIYRNEFYQLYLGDRYSTYRSAATVMALLLASYPLIYAHTMTIKVAYAKGRLRGVAILVIISQVLNVALSIYFVRAMHLGAVGSALGTLITDCVVQFGIPALPLTMRLGDLSIRRWLKELVLPGVLPGVIAGPVWLIFRGLFAPHSWATLIFCGTAGAVCYLVTLFAFSLDQQERRQAWELIGFMLNRMGIRKGVVAVPCVELNGAARK